MRGWDDYGGIYWMVEDYYSIKFRRNVDHGVQLEVDM
jgi:hypothetical protein